MNVPSRYLIYLLPQAPDFSGRREEGGGADLGTQRVEVQMAWTTRSWGVSSLDLRKLELGRVSMSALLKDSCFCSLVVGGEGSS